ncbi:hypothetical protein [Comamonas flocculans]|uniref:Penicillin-binding protein activator LpoB n=1 Tax=Comamonas flocculans TaxID=2597701 RepID=A0A5B8RTT3_9BURK|nr:hypothetical protein [Comamonas flocculans]QEA12900.1 hypothetical protein FOZ74_07595 [Comamonas flocculans]
MQRRTTLGLACALMAAGSIGGAARAQHGGAPVRIAVTNLAYAQQVSEYFIVGTHQGSSQVNARSNYRDSASHGRFSSSHSSSGSESLQASEQHSGTYVAGRYSYIEQRDLAGYTNDIKGALLQGSFFKLVQGKGFDAGAPQASKAEQVLGQVQGGKMAAPRAQPSVTDIVARIRKGEFQGADYVLFGSVSSIDFTDALSPLQGTTSATRQYGLQLLADFSLIHTRTHEIKAAFSAQGEGNDTRILSIRGDVAPPNRAKVMRETSLSLAQDVYQQLMAQLGLTAPGMAVQRPGAPTVYPAGQPVPAPQPEQVLILR